MSHGKKLSPLFTWRSAIIKSELPPTVRLVALVLSMHMNEVGGSCFPTHEQLKGQSGLGRSTVIKALRDLEEGGWIVREPGGGRRKGGNGFATLYSATVPEKDGISTDTVPLVGNTVQQTSEYRPPGGHQDAIQSVIEDVSAEPRANELAVRSPQVPTVVNRKRVTPQEADMAEAILIAWNFRAGQRYSSQEWLAKIVMRIREHPELTLDDHAEIIAAALKNPWWSGAAAPSVVYGNGAQFERQLTEARNPGQVASLPPAERALALAARLREEGR